MERPAVSIILRLKNEERFLPAVLKSLAKQTVKEFEVIVVDSGSSDKTLEILENWKARLNMSVFQIPSNDFTYPYACNYGARKAKGGVIGYLSGHSVPILDTYIEAGLKHFENKRIAGVYGPVLPLENAKFWEYLYYSRGLGFAAALKLVSSQRPRLLARPRVGLLGNTNSFLRRELWVGRPFNEAMVRGGEDTEWAYFYQKKGYLIAHEPEMVIQHSHGVGFLTMARQVLNWYQLYRQGKQLIERSLA